MSAGEEQEACFTGGAELGLHARPAGEFVALAGRFESRIQVGCGEEWVDGRSIHSLLYLGARRGTLLRLRAEGADAAAAVRALGERVERSTPAKTGKT